MGFKNSIIYFLLNNNPIKIPQILLFGGFRESDLLKEKKSV